MSIEIIGLLVVLILVLVLPFCFKKVEHNLEIFLFVMGILSVIISGVLNLQLLEEIAKDINLYIITGAVLIAGFLFKFTKKKINNFISYVQNKLPEPVLIFLIVVVLGFISSVITAIIAALILVEIVQGLHITHKAKIRLTIITCFSIGLGAILTPAGEPIAVVVTSNMKQSFWYLFSLLNFWIIFGVLAFGIFGGIYISKISKVAKDATISLDGEKVIKDLDVVDIVEETNKDILIRAGKVFLFVIALILLGNGFKLMIDKYVAGLNNVFLYWANIISAILDNATLASAEISKTMDPFKVKAILLGLLISGGMLIPGNIPNIISAGKLKIKSKEWAKFGIPVGLVTLTIYCILLFVFKLGQIK